MKNRTKIFISIILFIIVVITGITSYATISFFNGKNQAEKLKFPETNSNFIGDKSENPKEITVMIVGDDGRDDDEDEGRADTLMVAQYNSKTKQPKLVSIMRDSYVEIPDHGLDKINAAYAYGGAQLTKETMNDSFDLPINYYLVLDFDKFTLLVDDMYPKGVKIDVEKDINLDGVDLKKGEQILDGNSLLQYARFRMDEEGDFGRVRRQQQVMDALMDQAHHLMPILQLPKAVGEAIGSIDTNIPTNVFIDLGKDFILGKVKPLETLSVPVEGSWDFNDYTPSGSVLEIDEKENAQAIKEFLDDGERK